MGDLKYAIIMAAIVGLTLFNVCKLDEKKAHRLEGPNREGIGHNLQNDQITGVNIGQDPTNKDREGDGKGGVDGEFKKAYPEIFETKGQIVSFTAVWCGPCKLQKIQTAALKGRFNVLTYDIDEEHGRQLYEKLGCHSVPTLLVLVDGKEKKRWEGYTPASQIEPFAEEARKPHEKTRFNRLRIGGDDWRIDIDFRADRRCGISAATVSNSLPESPWRPTESEENQPLPTPAILVSSRYNGADQLQGENGLLYRPSGKRVPKRSKGKRGIFGRFIRLVESSIRLDR